MIYWVAARGWQLRYRLPELRESGELDPRLLRLEGGMESRFLRGAALRTGGDMRQVAREPEQLELEREPQRIEGRPVGRMWRGVEEIGTHAGLAGVPTSGKAG